MHIGYIDYLNCYPFYYHMFEKQKLKGITIIPGYPSELNYMMEKGLLDLSPVSAAAVSCMDENVCILDDFCLSSVGYVGSVILRSNYPIEDLDTKKIGLTSASKTSRVLLKLILSQYYNVKPDYINALPNPGLKDFDAVLVIGNEAMQKTKEHVPYTYDLGKLWLEKTGYPVVFAVFAVQENKIKDKSKEIFSVIQSYNESLKCLETESKNLVKMAKKKYSDILWDVPSYYNLLKFDFSPDLKKAFAFYMKKAGDAGLLKKDPRLLFFSKDNFFNGY